MLNQPHITSFLPSLGIKGSTSILPSENHSRLMHSHKSSLIDRAPRRFIWNCGQSILYEADADKNMSNSILFLWWTFPDCWRASCQDYFQSWQSIYYQRPLISPSLSDNDSARETTGDLHLNPPLGRHWQAWCWRSWHFMLVSLLIDAACNITTQYFPSCFITSFQSLSVSSLFLFVTIPTVNRWLTAPIH